MTHINVFVKCILNAPTGFPINPYLHYLLSEKMLNVNVGGICVTWRFYSPN